MYKLLESQKTNENLFACIYSYETGAKYVVVAYKGKRPPKTITKEKFWRDYASQAWSGKFKGEHDFNYMEALYTGISIGFGNFPKLAK